MVQNKLPKPVLLAYMILALIGSSAISAGKAVCFEPSNNDSLGSNGYFFSDRTIDWLAGNTLIRKKADSYSDSLLQSRLLNVFVLAGTIAIAISLAGANLKILKNDNIPIKKNLVLLKLRV